MKKESKSYDNKKSSQKAQPTISKGGCGCGCGFGGNSGILFFIIIATSAFIHFIIKSKKLQQ